MCVWPARGFLSFTPPSTPMQYLSPLSSLSLCTLLSLSYLHPSLSLSLSLSLSFFFCSVHCAAFNSNKSLFCFGFSDSSIRLWSELPLATDHMTSHDPSTITNRFEVTSSDQTTPMSSIPPLLGHRGAVYGMCFNNKGQYLLSSAEDCTVRLWDVDKRSCLVCYHGHQYPVWNVAFRYTYMYLCTVLVIHYLCIHRTRGSKSTQGS